MANKLDTTTLTIGQHKNRDMPSTGDAKVDDLSVIEMADGPTISKKDMELAFLEEPVEIFVHESTDPNAEPIVQTGCNGRTQLFVRGLNQIVKRKFVGVLAEAKKTSYTQQRYKDANGNDGIRNVPRTALLYPFSVVNDSNRAGADWLKKILASA